MFASLKFGNKAVFLALIFSGVVLKNPISRFPGCKKRYVLKLEHDNLTVAKVLFIRKTRESND